MAEYIANANGYLHGQGFIPKGKKFDYDGTPGKWMTPVNEFKPKPEKDEKTKLKEHTEAKGFLGELVDGPPNVPDAKPKAKGKSK